MTTRVRIRVFGITIMLLFALFGKSRGQQSGCLETLAKAQESFDAGRLYGISSLLKPCLDNGFNKSQRIQAYWLLTRTYLFIDDPISAEDSYLKLLRLDPEYKIDVENDPIDMVYLSKKFKTTPIFVLFGKLGFNTTGTSVIQNFGTDNTDLTAESYSNDIGFQIGGGVEWNVSDTWSVGVGVDLVSRGYTYTNSIFEFDDQQFIEDQTSFDIPIYVKYRRKINKFIPYVYAGFTQHLMFSADAEVSLTDRASGSNENLSAFPVTGPSENLDDVRQTSNQSIIFGLGSTYRIKYNYIFLDVRYLYGLNNIVDVDNQYSNNRLLYTYAFVDDDKRLNSLAVNVGFMLPLYKPRKIVDNKSGFLRKIFK
ncbi:MAG: outer membrane beta-barrel protein [Bacteroidota bacterium]